MPISPTPPKALSDSLGILQSDRDRTFPNQPEVPEELIPTSTINRNCLQLVNILAKLDTTNPEDESYNEIIRTEIIPDLLVSAIQLARVFQQDPISILLTQTATETDQVADLNELKKQVINRQERILEVSDIQKMLIRTASSLAGLCDGNGNGNGSTVSKNKIAISIVSSLITASMQLANILEVDVDVALSQRIKQVRANNNGKNDLIDQKSHSFEVSGPANLPTEHGQWKLYGFKDKIDRRIIEAAAIVLGEIDGEDNVIVRLHSQCITSEVLGSLRCDCKAQWDNAVQRIVAESRGLLVYVFEEGRGIGIFNKVAAYLEQDNGKDTIDANIAIGGTRII